MAGKCDVGSRAEKCPEEFFYKITIKSRIFL